MPPPNLYNSSGRGFPDVSAQGTSYPVVVGGSVDGSVDGTSCSTPTFSAIVSLLNDIRFAAGKPPLGFLNNLFYQNPQMFTDITTGSNPGCNTNGFTASQGWVSRGTLTSRQIDRQTDRQADGQTDETDRKKQSRYMSIAFMTTFDHVVLHTHTRRSMYPIGRSFLRVCARVRECVCLWCACVCVLIF